MTDLSLVMAANHWNTNADLIADCARLRYLKDTDRIIDPTFGRGNWWSTWSPTNGEIVAHDITLDGVDFRDLPHDDESFDVVAFDPPYVGGGGVKQQDADEFYDRYGLSASSYRSSAALQDLINDGLTEAYRVVRRGGFVLVKTMNYVNARRLQTGPFWTMTHGVQLGFEVYDLFEHVGTCRARPTRNKVQDHAKRNHSTLIVFRKMHRPRRGCR